MTEFEIYLPVIHNDGSAINPAALEYVKDILTTTYGGYTHLQQRNEGVWSLGGVTFRDEITIMRVLDDGSTHFDMKTFKRDLEKRFDQKSILIVRREVAAVG